MTRKQGRESDHNRAVGVKNDWRERGGRKESVIKAWSDHSFSFRCCARVLRRTQCKATAGQRSVYKNVSRRLLMLDPALYYAGASQMKAEHEPLIIFSRKSESFIVAN